MAALPVRRTRVGAGRRKDLGKSIDKYRSALSRISEVIAPQGGVVLPRARRIPLYEWAIIAAYAALETVMLEVLVSALNKYPQRIETVTGVHFGKAVTVAACRYLIVGDGYFGFKDRDDLRKTLKRFLGTTHPLPDVLSGERAAAALGVLIKARNHAAHQGDWSCKQLKAELRKRGFSGQDGLSTAGAWLAAIDNSDAWAETMECSRGRPRIIPILEFLKGLAGTIQRHGVSPPVAE